MGSINPPLHLEQTNSYKRQLNQGTIHKINTGWDGSYANVTDNKTFTQI